MSKRTDTVKDKSRSKSAAQSSGGSEPISTTEPTHIDDWLDRPSFVVEGGAKEAYARWVFEFFRLPAYKQVMYRPFMQAHRLFCTFEGKRWRVTGASRLGDVWLTSDFQRDTGYDRRVNVDGCSEWGPLSGSEPKGPPLGGYGAAT